MHFVIMCYRHHNSQISDSEVSVQVHSYGCLVLSAEHVWRMLYFYYYTTLLY